jgi:hypothetical protein
VKNTTFKLGKRRFCLKCPGIQIPASSLVFKLVKKMHSASCLLDKKYTRQNAVLSEEELDEIEARIEHSPFRSLTCISIGFEDNSVESD